MSRIELYRPSNGTEGEIFQANWCRGCRKHERETSDGNYVYCLIASDAFVFDIEDRDYPREWRYVDGVPTCTAFVDATIPVVRSHKPGRTQLPLFDDGTDWTRILVAADAIDETDPKRAAKIRELVALKNPKSEALARAAMPEMFGPGDDTDGLTRERERIEQFQQQ